MATTTVLVDHSPAEETAALDILLAAAAAPVDPPFLQQVEPVTLELAKAHLRVSTDDDDAYIAGLITAARQAAEGRLNRTIMQCRRVARFAGWNWVFPLPRPPVISVDSIGYLDESGGEIMLDAGTFFLADSGEEDIPVAELNLGDVPLPTLASGRTNPVRVYYTAGYAPGEVPQPIVQWMLLAIGTMYQNRENEVVGATVAALPDDFSKWLLQPYRVYE